MAFIHDDIELYREAIRSTQLREDFNPRLIEKDYFCSILLELLVSTDSTLIFKGGTCLAKVHCGFYRMSEDLDFTIPMSLDAKRSVRQEAMKGMKNLFSTIPKKLPFLEIAKSFVGANASTQYQSLLTYRSPLTGDRESIKVEIALREPLLEPVYKGEAKTLLVDPITGESFIKGFPVSSLSLREAYAEKFRAALTRRTPAIRDYFDIDYVVRMKNIKIDDDILMKLVGKKLEVSDPFPGANREEWNAILKGQLETQLKPVLRTTDFEEFSLERAIKMVETVENKVKKLLPISM